MPIFTIPEDIKGLIKNDIVPKVLDQPLSPMTYKDYFAALLYAEEFYLEVSMNINGPIVMPFLLTSSDSPPGKEGLSY